MESAQLSKRQSALSNDAGNGPSLWVFLIIVLGVLLALVLGTSAIMHLIQARQRRNLTRRIANGEVDLEQLGLKRLNVPQEQVNKMPQYVFSGEVGDDVQKPEPVASTTAPIDHRRSTMYAQSTCSICLDDFIEKETTVRELPCKHIFHPECIDPFLMNNSSLCPLCKTSSLPAGFCPVTVTNVMVRRERLGRAMRNQNRQRGEQRHFHYVRSAAQQQRAQQSATTAAPPTQDTELDIVQPRRPTSMAIPPEIALQGREARRQWRREHIARQHSAEFEAQGEEARMAEARRPLWRRMMGIA